jgi:HTH-type transcriptional regulator / antitoxin HigA
MSTINKYRPTTVTHPGVTLEETLEELGMGPKEFAVRSGKPEKTITAILKGESSITPDMAVQFEAVLHIPAHFWLNRQRAYDEALSRSKSKSQLTAAIAWAKKFPIREMINKGWLPELDSWEEKTEALLRFFRISSNEAWEDFYYRQILKNDFRISLCNTKEPEAISSWLRQGEIEADKLEAPPYDEKKFKNVLVQVKKIMVDHPSNFFEETQTTCLEAGVKVVYTPCLPKAPISGCARWLNNSPLIQLSNRYKRNDIFWFTFFHEAGHICLHGKKDIFLEEVEYDDKDINKENEADEFAIKWTFSREEEEEMLQQFQIDEEDVVAFAKKYNTHPAIIVGRLRKKALKSATWGSSLIISIDL